MKNLILTSISKDDLETLIIDCVNACLKHHQPEEKIPKEQNDYLTKKEAAKFLSCSVSTIDNYRRAGVIKRHNVGSSVRFKRSELIAAVNQKK